MSWQSVYDDPAWREGKFWAVAWTEHCRPHYVARGIRRYRPIASVDNTKNFHCCVCGEKITRGFKYRHEAEWASWEREHNVGCARREVARRLGLRDHTEAEAELEASLWRGGAEEANVLADLLLERGFTEDPDEVLDLFGGVRRARSAAFLLKKALEER